MKSKKRIVFFNGFYLPHLGGVERYTYNLVSELKKKYNITIVTSNVPKSKSYEVIDGIEIYRLPTYKIFKNRFPVLKKNREYRKVVNILNNMNIDHIICNTRYYNSTLLGERMAKNKNIDLCVIDHSSGYISLDNKLLDLFINRYEDYVTKGIKKTNARFYGVSKKCNDWLKHYDIKSSGVFYNSIVDRNTIKKNNFNRVRITYVGRIIKEKGVENLAKAYYLLKDKYNIELVIAGDGKYLNYMKTNYPDIRYTGVINHDEIMNILKDTSIFVHPSLYPEGMPTSILEAGIMKCAIIATDKGGTKEIIKSNKYGLIIEENVDDLVNKLDFLLSNHKTIVELQNNIYKRIKENFVWEYTAKQIIKELKKYE